MSSTRLRFLQDSPINENKNSISKLTDSFKHSGYINSLYQLSNDCPTPFCVGLFGGWGTGKTGIVKGLAHLARDNANIRFLYFDVWKHSADSLRRQLLIEIDRQWFNGVNGYEKSLYVNTVKTTDFTTSISKDKIISHLKWVIPLVLLILILAFIKNPLGFSFSEKDWSAIIGTAILPVFAMLIASVQSEGKTNSVVEDASKPTSPEEFERLFKQTLQLKGSIRNVFILDNLDRVEDQKVFEVLTGISTFLGEANCIYIIPCDEKRLKVHLRNVLLSKGEPNDNMHADDFLRKLFNAQISLRPILEGQLVPYINSLLTDIGVKKPKDIEALQLILTVGLSRNPRRVKQFLNNFVACYNLALDLENSDNGNASLPKGLITGNMGFLAKVVFLRNHYQEAYEHFEKHAGSFSEVEQLIKLKQIDENTLGDNFLEGLIQFSIEGHSLRNFLGATLSVSDPSPDIFLHFSGNSDLSIVRANEEIVNSLMTLNYEESYKRISKKTIDKEYLSDLSSDISERLKSISLGKSLKINMISSLLKLNTIPSTVNLETLEFSGKLISKIPEDLLRKLGSYIDPIIWTMSEKKFISHARTQSIARIIYKENKNALTDLDMLEVGQSKNVWSTLKPHFIRINASWEILESDSKGLFRKLIYPILELEIKSSEELTEDLWNWLLPEKGDIPPIMHDADILLQVANLINSIGKNTEQVKLAGNLVSRLNKYSQGKPLSELFKSSEKLFKNDVYSESKKESFAANVVKDWVTQSDKRYSSVDVHKLITLLEDKKQPWQNEGYLLSKEWYKPFISLYDRAISPSSEKVKNLIVSYIKSSPKSYIKEFSENRFEDNKSLNYYAFNAFISVNDIDKLDEVDQIIEDLLLKVYEGNAAEIKDQFLEDVWTSNAKFAKDYSVLINSKICELKDQLDTLEPLVKIALTYLEDFDFWGNKEPYQEGFIEPILRILEEDKRIKSNDRDNMLEPFLKKLTNNASEDFKKSFKPFRNYFFKLLSVNSKKRTLNQIWTLFIKLTDVKEDNPDLEFLFENIQFAKEQDKKEIATELLEQLSSGSPNGVELFLEFGTVDIIILANQANWVEEVITFLEQSEEATNGEVRSILKSKLDILTEKSVIKQVQDYLNQNPKK